MAGTSTNSDFSVNHAFLSGANGGTLKDLGTLPGDTNSTGSDVNSSGQVTGGGDTHAFLSGANGGALKDLGTLAGDAGSFGDGVNDAGQVTGVSGNSDFSVFHAFLSGANGGALKDLGTLPGDVSSEGNRVNNSGQVVGNSIDSNFVRHAFLSGANGGALEDLGTLPGDVGSDGYGINDAGQVVGNSYDNSHYSAFLFSNGVMTDLNSLIAPGSGFILSTAEGISNTGFITGVGFDKGGQYSFLLTPMNAPVPEASTTISFGLLLALGLGGVVVAGKRKRKA